MQELKVKDFFWKSKNGRILQVRIQYAEGSIKVYTSKGHRILKWEGLTRQQINEIEKHFKEIKTDE